MRRLFGFGNIWKSVGVASLCLILSIPATLFMTKPGALAEVSGSDERFGQIPPEIKTSPRATVILTPFQSGDRLIFAATMTSLENAAGNPQRRDTTTRFFDADSQQVFTDPNSYLNSQIDVHNPPKIEKSSCKERGYFCLLKRLGFSDVRRRLSELVTGRYVRKYSGEKIAEMDEQITRPRTVWFRVAVRRYFRLPVGYLADISSTGGNCSQPVSSFLAYFDKERQISREISLLEVLDTDEPFVVREECQVYGVESYGPPGTPYRASTRTLNLDNVYVLSDKRVLLTFPDSLQYLIFSGAFPSDLNLQDRNVFVRDAEATADCLEALIKAKEAFLKEFRASRSGQEAGLYHRKGQEAAFELIDSGMGDFAKTGRCQGEK